VQGIHLILIEKIQSNSLQLIQMLQYLIYIVMQAQKIENEGFA